MRYLLDTNVLSELRRRNAEDSVAAWMRVHSADAMFLSVATVYEVELGIRRLARRDPRQADALCRWLDGQVLPRFTGRILALDMSIMRVAAALHVPDPRPERDSYIAATALRHGMTVVSRNRRDFAPIGVAVLNPWSTAPSG